MSNTVPNPAESREDAIARVRDLADNLSERYDHREHWVETVAAIRTVLALLDSEGAVAEGERAEGRPPRSKVVCPDCGRKLGDVIDSLIRQRGKFKAQRQEARRRAASTEAELARLRKALSRGRIVGLRAINDEHGPFITLDGLLSDLDRLLPTEGGE